MVGQRLSQQSDQRQRRFEFVADVCHEPTLQAHQLTLLAYGAHHHPDYQQPGADGAGRSGRYQTMMPTSRAA